MRPKHMASPWRPMVTRVPSTFIMEIKSINFNPPGNGVEQWHTSQWMGLADGHRIPDMQQCAQRIHQVVQSHFKRRHDDHDDDNDDPTYRYDYHNTYERYNQHKRYKMDDEHSNESNSNDSTMHADGWPSVRARPANPECYRRITISGVTESGDTIALHIDDWKYRYTIIFDGDGPYDDDQHVLTDQECERRLKSLNLPFARRMLSPYYGFFPSLENPYKPRKFRCYELRLSKYQYRDLMQLDQQLANIHAKRWQQRDSKPEDLFCCDAGFGASDWIKVSGWMEPDVFTMTHQIELITTLDRLERVDRVDFAPMLCLSWDLEAYNHRIDQGFTNALDKQDVICCINTSWYYHDQRPLPTHKNIFEHYVMYNDDNAPAHIQSRFGVREDDYKPRQVREKSKLFQVVQVANVKRICLFYDHLAKPFEPPYRYMVKPVYEDGTDGIETVVFSSELAMLVAFRDLILANLPDYMYGHCVDDFDWKQLYLRLGTITGEVIPIIRKQNPEDKSEAQVRTMVVDSDDDEDDEDPMAGDGPEYHALELPDHMYVSYDQHQFKQYSNPFIYLGRYAFKACPLMEESGACNAFGSRTSVYPTQLVFQDVDLKPSVITTTTKRLDDYTLNTIGQTYLSEQKVDYPIKRLNMDYRDGYYRPCVAYGDYDTLIPIGILLNASLMVSQIYMGRANYQSANNIIKHGQRRRAIAGLQVDTSKKDILLEDSWVVQEKYKGAIVFEPTPGFYDQVVTTLDFASYYPRMIQNRNLDGSTFMRMFDENLKPVKPSSDPAILAQQQADFGRVLTKVYGPPKIPAAIQADRAALMDWKYLNQHSSRATEAFYVDDHQPPIHFMIYNPALFEDDDPEYSPNIRGIMPQRLDMLGAQRDAAKADMKREWKEYFDETTSSWTCRKAKDRYNNANDRQLSFKVNQNSMYGVSASLFIYIAKVTTYCCRRMTMYSKFIVTTRWFPSRPVHERLMHVLDQAKKDYHRLSPEQQKQADQMFALHMPKHYDDVPSTSQLIEFKSYEDIDKPYVSRWGISVIYGDTDSIFNLFKCILHDADHGIDLYRSELASMMGKDQSKFICDIFKKCHLHYMSLEWEKMFYPFLITGKKSYMGDKFLIPGVVNSRDGKGMQKRDCYEFIRKLRKSLVDIVLDKKPFKAGLESLISPILLRMLDARGRIDKLGNIKDFIMTKQLRRDDYKTPPMHVEANNHLKAKYPGRGYQLGDRVPIFVIDLPSHPKVGDRARTLREYELILENQDTAAMSTMALDIAYYISRIESNLKPVIKAVDPSCLKIFTAWLERANTLMRAERGWTVVAGRGKNAKTMIKVQTIASFMAKHAQSSP